MTTKYDYIKEKFEELKRKVKTDNKKNLLDIYKYIEDISMHLLNDMYGLGLKKSNLGTQNFRFDLIDIQNKIFIDVKLYINSMSVIEDVIRKVEKVNNIDIYSNYKLIIFVVQNNISLSTRTIGQFSKLKIELYTYDDVLEELNDKPEIIDKVYKTLRDFFTNDTWYIIYSKFAQSLFEFYQLEGKNSGRALYEDYMETDSKFEILPWAKHFDEYNVSSLDPIHIFASFTYWNIRLETRKKKMLFFCNLLENYNIDVSNLKNIIENATEENFRYFPHPNITYIVSARKHEIQNEVWEFFGLIYQNIDGERLEYLYNNINSNWYGIKIEFATIFMFWINSENFLSLDKNTLDFLKKKDKLNQIPTNYVNYKKLIKNSNEFLFLYRNLTKIANNESFINELIEIDRIDFEAFFDEKLIEANTIVTQILDSTQLDIDKIEEFEFEFYFMVYGKARKILYQNNNKHLAKLKKIKWFQSLKQLTLRDYNYQWIEFCKNSNIKINELTVINPENINHSNFQIIAIKVLNEKYTKVLEVNKLYFFTNNIEIGKDENSVIVNENTSNIYDEYQIKNINITAIVGKNGTGKSTIIDFLMMAFNNIAKSFDDDNTLGYLNEFFYTIQMNYSMHSLNSKKYEGEWLTKLFHKNDSYQTPIVIEPYREEGNIDVNILEDLTEQRLLSTILEYHLENSEDYTKLTETKKVTYLEIKENSKKIKKILKFLNQSRAKEDNLDEILSYYENKQIIEYINNLIGTPTDSDLYQNYRKVAELYICYKVQNIVNTYSIYTSYKDKVSTKEFLDMLIDDKTHRTFKLHQAIYFLKYGTLTSLGKIAIDELSISIKNIAEKPSLVSSSWKFDNIPSLSVIELVPPPFFEINIFLKDEISGNEDIPFETLSSGEKQKIYSISSIIYHLQNIQSVHRVNDESIKYNNVNIVLDEIELYFHPDMQRTYIYDLLQAIENKGGFNNISALNIIMVTHSPFILSDIVENNIMYLGTEDKKLENTFGANIHTLLDNSFFMNDGLMGKFAKEKIKSLIVKLNEYKEIDDEERDKKVSQTERNEIKRIISQIGEPFLKKKLFDMYFSIFDEKNSEVLILEREKKKLEEQIRKLQQ